MRSWTPPAEHGLLWWDDDGVCCCCGDGEEDGGGGGEGGERAGSDGGDVSNSVMYPGSNSLKKRQEIKMLF